MNDLLRALLNALDIVCETNEEICDTECREQMGVPIFAGFLMADSKYVMPDEFGLLDERGNHAVKKAISDYVESAKAAAKAEGLTTFHQRLAAFQNEDICSDHEGSYYDDFFGCMNPDDFDAAGNAK